MTNANRQRHGKIGALLSLTAVLLAACASAPPPSQPMPEGAQTAAPVGWVIYCNTHRSDPSCSL